MQINQISNPQPTFGKLYSGESLKKALPARSCPLTRKYQKIKKYIRAEKLHLLKNINITLNYSNCDGFYGVISNKEKKVPLKSNDYYFKINHLNSSTEAFKKWVIKWNEIFAK